MNLEPGWHSRYSDCTVRASNQQQQGTFFFSESPRPALGPNQSPFQWVPAFFSGDKAADDDHSPLSSVKVKNEWSYTSTPLVCLHGMDRDLTFFLMNLIQQFSYFLIPSEWSAHASQTFSWRAVLVTVCDTYQQPPQGCIKVGDHFTWMTKFCIMVHNICGSLEWNLINVTLLVIGMFT